MSFERARMISVMPDSSARLAREARLSLSGPIFFMGESFPPKTWYFPLHAPDFSIAAISEAFSTTHTMPGILDLSEHISHGCPFSDSPKHSGQGVMRPSAAVMDSAISAASARFSRARYMAMRSALLSPVPGSFLRALLSLSKDLLIFESRRSARGKNRRVVLSAR